MALPGLVGLSRAWADIYAQARAAARDRVPLLIVGEQGVGKLALARAAHQDNEPARHLTVIDCANDDAARLRAAHR